MSQRGYIWKENGAWYGRWRETVLVDGKPVRKQRAEKLADYCDDYRTKADVRPLLHERLEKVNGRDYDPQSTMPLADFFERVYLPHVTAEKRASTVKGYREIWNNHVASRIGQIRVRDLRTVHVSRMLQDIAAQNDLSALTLRHIKAFVSGLINHARNEGLYDGANPVQGVKIPKARRPGDTHSYTLNEIERTLAVLDGLPRAVVAVAAYSGLRVSEIRGLDWSDYDGNTLRVSRNAWRHSINPPKTPKSEAPVPAIQPLREILDSYRESVGNPEVGPMFRGIELPRVDMDKLALRIVRPAMGNEGIAWHGWHAFRRGIATVLYSLGCSDKVVQRILRHARATVTRELYIKETDPDVRKGMERVSRAIKKERKRLRSSFVQ